MKTFSTLTALALLIAFGGAYVSLKLGYVNVAKMEEKYSRQFCRN